VDETLAERYLERMIGRMIDVNYHLLTQSEEAPPQDYHESFLALARLGVLDLSFARQLVPCAGLRNRIVHDYDEIDPARVFAAIGAALRDVAWRDGEAWHYRLESVTGLLHLHGRVCPGAGAAPGGFGEVP